MKLSVIVPVYNMAGAGKLDHCLDSLTGQTIDDYEILAVDDCSTDGSWEIIQKYAAGHNEEHSGCSENHCVFRALRNERNRHQGGARNHGLEEARGEWISFVDSDDWVSPDYFEKLLNKAGATGADMVGCDYCMTDHYGFDVGKVVHNNRSDQVGVLDDAKYRSLILESGSLAVKIYRREIIIDCKSRFPEDIFYEDNAIANTWMLRAKHFEYLPYEGAEGKLPTENDAPIYYYYQHETSTVHTVTRKRLEDRMAAGRGMIEEAKRYGYYEKYKPEIEFSFTVLFYVNTLFSAMREGKNDRNAGYEFVTALAKEMRAAFPGFMQNKYYLERVDKEEQKYIAMQQKDPKRFYMQYKALWLYRDTRAKFIR